MTLKKRSLQCAAAVSLAGVVLFPITAGAATGDVDVTITNHLAQDAVEGPNVSVQANFVSLTQHKIARVEFLVDGQVVDSHTLDEPAPKGSFLFAWDTTRLSNEVHTITTRAIDEAGGVGSCQLLLLVDNQQVDQAMPLLRVTVPRDGAVVSGQFMIQADATPRSPYEQIKFMEIMLDNDLVGLWGTQENTARLLYSDTLPDGPHRIRAVATLENGTRVEAPPIIVIVDKGGGNTPRHNGATPPPIDPTGDSQGQPNPPSNPPPASPNINVQLKGENSGPAAAAPTTGTDGALTQQAYGAGMPGSHSGPPPAATGHSPNPAPQNSIIAALPRTTPDSTFQNPPDQPSPHAAPSHSSQSGVSQPTGEPIAEALEPTPGHPLVEEFHGFYYPGLASQKSVEPQGLPARGSTLNPSLALRSPDGDSSSRSIFQPAVTGSAMSIVPQVAEPAPVIIVETNDPHISRTPPLAPAGVAPTPQLSPAIRSALPPMTPAVPAGPGYLAAPGSSAQPVSHPAGPAVLSPAILSSSAAGSPLDSPFSFAQPASSTSGMEALAGPAAMAPYAPVFGSPVESAQPVTSSSEGSPDSRESSPALVPVPLVALPSAGQPSPDVPPVLISTNATQYFGSLPGAGVSTENPVFLPVPLVIQPSQPAAPASRHSHPGHAARSRSPQMALRGSLPTPDADNTMFVPAPAILMPAAPTVHSHQMALLPRPTPESSEFARLKAHQGNTPKWLRVAYDQHWMNFDVQPMLYHGIPTAPFRTIFERSGGMVTWHPDTKTVEAVSKGRTVTLKIGSPNATIDHQVVQMEIPAFIKRGRTMVPVGFVRQAMNVNVEFDTRTGEVIITSKNVVAMSLK